MIHEAIDSLLLAAPPRLAKHYRAYKWWRWGEPEVHLVPVLCDRRKLSVDVGASRGLYSYFIGRKSRHCLAFEPNHELHAQLKLQAINTTIYGCALSDRCGATELRIPREHGRLHPGSATIEPANRLSAEAMSMEIEARTLDSFALNEVGFIKVDTEGHELAFLHGAKKTLASSRPRMLIEAEGRHRPDAIPTVADFLGRLDYLGFYLVRDKLEPISAFDPSVHQRRDSGFPYVANFVFVHSSDRLLKRNGLVAPSLLTSAAALVS